jgi:hypothetical protein
MWLIIWEFRWGKPRLGGLSVTETEELRITVRMPVEAINVPSPPGPNVAAGPKRSSGAVMWKISSPSISYMI